MDIVEYEKYIAEQLLAIHECLIDLGKVGVPHSACYVYSEALARCQTIKDSNGDYLLSQHSPKH